jgi:hypothetical protein
MTVAEVFSEAQLVRHSRLHVARTRAAMFFLHLQVDGRSLNRQDGREAALTAGDFTLCDSTRPYEMQFDGPNHMFVLGIPDAALRRHLASPECLVAIRMPGSSGLSGLLSDFLRHFWREYQSGLDDAAASRVTSTILDLISSAYSVAPQARADDGLLDLVVFERRGAWNWARHLFAILRGRTAALPDFQHRLVRKFRLAAASPAPLQIDGDPAGQVPSEIEVLPGALRLLVSPDGPNEN